MVCGLCLAAVSQRWANKEGAVSCFGIVWKTYEAPTAWITGNELLRHTIGAASPPSPS